MSDVIIDLSKIEKELTLKNDLKIEELKIKLYELRNDYKMDSKEYRSILKKVNSFRKR